MKRALILYSILLSLIFIFYGSMDLLCGIVRWFMPARALPDLVQISLSFDLGRGRVPAITLDPGMGLSLLVIGFSLLYGGLGSLKGKLKGGESFFLVGSILALILLVLQVLILFANGVETYALRIEDFSGWTPLEDLNEGLVLGLLAIPTLSSSVKRLRSLRKTGYQKD